MSSPEIDVLVIGAGAAGLAATRALDRAGFRVLCLEARDRVGGRIHTIHDALSPIPIELGAEFIHGRPHETWDIAANARLMVCEGNSSAVYSQNGEIQDEDQVSAEVGQIMDDIQRAANNSPDKSFSSFLSHSSYSSDAKQWATSYVEGFNAARRDVVGIASLAQDSRASKQIDGDRMFRILNGYDSLPYHLLQEISHKVRLNSVVQRIEWQPGNVTVHVRSAAGHETLRSRQVLVTIPLGLLQARPDERGAIQFDPEPHDILHAAASLRFGEVIRVTLRFTEPFWETKKERADAGFFFSQEPVFPTWWTTLPVRTPLITGWSAGHSADGLLGQSTESIVHTAVATLTRIVGTSPARLETAYFHPWHEDPFARGAYSYVPAGAFTARAALAQPVADTLYFAGEATDVNGRSATVHGALASGARAAQQILQQRRSTK